MFFDDFIYTNQQTNFSKKIFLPPNFKVQVEEQTQMIEQLKQALNASSIDLEQRRLHQKSSDGGGGGGKTAHKPVSTIQTGGQLTESQNKIAKMDHEISMYKDKLAHLNQLKSNASHHHHHHNYYGSDSGTINDQNNHGFYLKNNDENFNSRSSNGMIDSLVETSSPAVTAAAAQSGSVKVVKVSRKDLRRLTDEEILKRSLNKKDGD